MNLFDTHVNFTPIILALWAAVGTIVMRSLGRFAVAEVVGLLRPYVGDQQALVVQQRANELLDKAVNYALLEGRTFIADHGLTIDVQNFIAARIAQYATDHAPDLAQQIGGLTEKGLARLLPHPAVQAALAEHAGANDNASKPIAAAA